ncbi:MAG: glycosyltransferase family 4 protein [Anaerolineales bacterium]
MTVRILFVADGRSAIARGWIQPLIERGHVVHLATTFPSQPWSGLQSFHSVNVGFSGLGRKSEGSVKAPGGASGIGLRSLMKHWLGPLTVLTAAQKLRRVLNTADVDLVHALRIPFEGMLTARANPTEPFVLSVWGNDFTLHAQASPWMSALTRKAVRRADALHADCRRDVRLAFKWGLTKETPTIVLPGGGGIDRSIFSPGDPLNLTVRSDLRELIEHFPKKAPVVINPRGFRAYVRNDTFFRALKPILAAYPDTHFLMPGMAGEARAEQWLQDPQIREHAHSLPTLNAVEMAALYRCSDVVVSPSEHDGTPNSFLEAIACGCFPVVGDLESLREWIEPGRNGELIDPADADQLAGAVCAAIENPRLRLEAQSINQAIVDKRAARRLVTDSAEAFYENVLRNIN